jgi:hypothetical protein
VHGVAVDGTGRSVDESELDGNQFYPRKSNVQLDSQDLLKLRAFQNAFEHNVGNPLPREDIERFIVARGLAVRLTSKGEAVLKRWAPSQEQSQNDRGAAEVLKLRAAAELLEQKVDETMPYCGRRYVRYRTDYLGSAV